ncbi:MAG: hypothetical protein GEV05_24710 [Betaproteobacteria bacterium]|nr:hypothetical protein [Betaproteobacteria bacterium]
MEFGQDVRDALIDALSRRARRNRDAFGERYRDHDLSGRGEDFWREYNVMAYECEAGIDVARETDLGPGESWLSWLDRVDQIFLKKRYYEASKAIAEVRVHAFRSMDSDQVVLAATGFVTCDVYDPAIESVEEEAVLRRIATEAACNGARRNAACKLVRLFPGRYEELLRTEEVEKPPFAERVKRDATEPDWNGMPRPATILGHPLNNSAIEQLVGAAQGELEAKQRNVAEALAEQRDATDSRTSPASNPAPSRVGARLKAFVGRAFGRP